MTRNGTLAALAVLLCLLGAVLAASMQAPPRLTPDRVAAIEQRISETVEAIPIEGLAVVMVQDGETVLLKGYGKAGPDGKAVTRDTLFNVASLTKAVTGAGVLILAERGAVDLDAPVTTYLPDLRLARSGAADRITLRHLMSHHSGLSAALGRAGPDAATVVPDREAFLAILAEAELQGPPGEWYDYSNANYWILAHVIEAVTGRPYAAFIGEDVLRPLGMQDSHVGPSPADAAAATPHDIWFFAPRPRRGGEARVAFGASDLLTTPADLGRWMTALTMGHPALPDGALETMATPSGPVFPISQNPPATGHSGLGWYVTSHSGYRLMSHGGHEAGWRATIGLSPEGRSGIAILANTDNGFFAHDVYGAIGNIRRAAFGQSPLPLQPFTVERGALAVLGATALFCVLGVIHLGMKARRGTLRRDGKWRYPVGVILPSAVLIAMGTALIFAVPLHFGTTAAGAVRYAPDAALALFGTAGLLVVVGIFRLVIIGISSNRSGADMRAEAF